jgi:hypothetical protein
MHDIEAVVAILAEQPVASVDAENLVCAGSTKEDVIARRREAHSEIILEEIRSSATENEIVGPDIVLDYVRIVSP